MYRATYPMADFDAGLPKDYSGTAFKDPPESIGVPPPEPAAEMPASASPKLPESLFGLKLPSLKNFKLSSIGLEEILIIATAAILFFNKDGDKECAIMLLLLLFIGG